MTYFDMTFLFSFMILFNAMILCMYKPPILMLIGVISQTLMVCLMLKSMFKITWFSFILFLIFIGGLMILFIYIISLASNNEINQDKTKTMMLSLLLMVFLTSCFYTTLLNQDPQITYFYVDSTALILQKIYSLSSMAPIIMLMAYLLLVLLITVSMVLLKSAPLRSFSKIL